MDAPLLIKRELGVPEEYDGSGLWKLDHLFIDSEGTPILVEVKRSSNTQIRREVVGQMLDYAVNASKYWTVDFLKNQLKDRLGNDYKKRLEEFTTNFESEDEFWKNVKNKLRSREIKLVFVADGFPSILTSIIRFLSEEMTTIDVYGVSIKKYKDTISVSIIESENAGTNTHPDWTKSSMLESIEEACGHNPKMKAEQLFEWCDKHNYIENYGKTGSFRPKGLINNTYYYPFFLWYNGSIEISLYSMKQKEGFINKEERIEIIEKLNKIPGVNKPHSQAGTYPTFNIKLLSHQKSFDLFLEYLNWFDDKIEEMLEDEND